MMVRLRPERFQPRVTKKLHACSSGPYEILNRVGPNAYVLNLPSDLGISSTFNVEDLVHFHGSSSPFVNPFSNPQTPVPQFPQPIPPPPPLAHRREVIEDILDEQTISTRQGGYQKYLVKWKDKPETDYT